MDDDWTNNGTCIATDKDKSCGPGMINQIRNCIDGTIDKCTSGDRKRTLPCRDVDVELPDCPRVIGDWADFGACTAVGKDKNCGAGLIIQKRTCKDGTNDKCKDVGLQQQVSCDLPACPKKLGDWKTVGTCKTVGEDANCGPGNATQTRTCTNGTSEHCSLADMERTVSCKQAGISLPECKGMSVSLI